jgi:hypothetical protein
MRHHVASFIMSGALALQAGAVWALTAAATRLTTSTAGWLLDKAGFDSGRTACQAGRKCDQLTCDQTNEIAP